MVTRVADRLSAARRRGFVGRAAEIGVFCDLLDAPELPIAVLFVQGPAGVGKSTLLRKFVEIGTERAVPSVLLDARDLPPVPDVLAEMPGAQLTMAEPHGRTVVLLDTYELLESIDSWLREELLTQLPADTLVVIATQHMPTAGWRADPGWAALVRVVRLHNLSPEESSAYLSRRGVKESLHASAVDLTHGHPLALALVGEPVQSLIAVQLARHYLLTPGLAITLLPFADPDAWAEFARTPIRLGCRPPTS